MLQDTFKLHQDEHVIIYVRKHWIFLLIEIVATLLLFILPSVFLWTLQLLGLSPDFMIFGVTFDALTNIFIFMWGIFCWLRIAEKFTDYSLDFWVVTNKRIVESELIKLFDRQLSTLELQDIEDITIRNKGFWANYFGYGSLEVQTAGAQNEFIADFIAKPEAVQQIMFNAKLKDENEKKSFELGEIHRATESFTQQDALQDLKLQELFDRQNKIENINQFSETPNQTDAIKFDTTTKTQTSSQQTEQDPTPVQENDSYDWAHINQKQKQDIRNLQAQIEEVESKYKKNISAALRSDSGNDKF